MNISELDIPTRINQTSDHIISSGRVLSGNDVTFDAKNFITLDAGFDVEGSSNFTATIGGCDN